MPLEDNKQQITWNVIITLQNVVVIANITLLSYQVSVSVRHWMTGHYVAINYQSL